MTELKHQNGSELTADEEELYDRQIRLWGVESQRKLRNARVLIIGMNGLGAEVVKNIVLSGVKKLVMLDNSNVTELDGHSQFLSPVDSLGQNRAKSSVERAKVLNSLVEIEGDSDSFDDKPDEFFRPWHVIIGIGMTTKQSHRLNKLCREFLVKCFIGDVFGMFGYCFTDLQTHTFVEEVVKRSVKRDKNPTTGEKKYTYEEVTEKVFKTTQFPSYPDAFDIDFNTEEGLKLSEQLPLEYFILRVLHAFRSAHGRDPLPSSRDEDMKELANLVNSEVTISSVKDKIPLEIFSLVFSQISPVCAIVGGVLAQEVIKAVSQKGVPHNNTFFYNPISNCGFISSLGN